jgi:hypothetical protein
MRHAWRNIASPSWPSRCSEKRTTGGAFQELTEQRPALRELQDAKIVAVEVQEVEGVEARCSAAKAAQERIEVRYRLAVQHDPGDRQGHDGRGDGDQLGGPVPPVPGPEVHAIAILMSDDPEAVVLQLVDPLLTDRNLQGEDRLAWADEARWLAPFSDERGNASTSPPCNLRTIESP